MIASKKYRGIFLNPLKNSDISYYIGYTDIATGDYRKIKIGLKSQGITEVYCYNKRSEILNNIRLGENPLLKSSKNKKLLYDALAENYFRYLETIHKSPKSIKNEKSRYQLHIQKYIGLKNSYTISAGDINKILNEKIENGLSQTTVKHIKQLIATIFNHAIKTDKFNAKNPAQSLEVLKIKLNNSRERYLDKFEIEQLLNYDKLQRNPLLVLFVKFAISTGARLGTILDIKRKDININTRAVTLNNLKTNSTYNGFLSEKLFPSLEFLRTLKPNDYVVSKNGLQTEQTRIQHPLKAILDELFNEGLDKKDSRNRVVVHTLRHTFASNLAISGTPMYHIQKLLDHKDQAMTQRYAKLAPDSGFSYVNSML